MFLLNSFVYGNPNILLDLPFSSDTLDKSVYNTTMRVASGSPVISSGSLYVPASSCLMTGSIDGEEQAQLDLTNRLYTIEYDFKNATAGAIVTIFDMAKTLTGASAGGASTSPSSSSLTVYNTSGAGVFTSHSLGYDASTQFTNVKIKRVSSQGYELYVNDVLVKTATTSTGVMFNADGRGKGVRFKASVGAAFYIKNFKITSNGSV